MNGATTDPELIEKYDEVYADGEEKFWTFLPVQERCSILTNVDLTGKEVLEIGCGTGDFAAWMATSGAAQVNAYDMSQEAIDKARGKYGTLINLDFFCCDPLQPACKPASVDVVVAVGVIEHTENPLDFLNDIQDTYMRSGSILAFSCPCLLNPRGYVWGALKYLFDAPMSLTDKHEIGPGWVKETAEKIGLELIKQITVDLSWGTAERMIIDYARRLPKVFPDMDPEKIGRLLEFLSRDMGYHKGDGANAVYILRKP